MRILVTAVILYGPLLLFALTMVMSFKIKASSVTTFTAQPLGIFGVSFPINNQLLVRCLAVVSALGFLLLYLFYDYSSFFPSALEMDVYFDRSGVVDVTNRILSTSEQKTMGFVVGDDQLRQRYFGILDNEARLVLGDKLFFTAVRAEIHSTGRTTFKVRKISGLQRYHIDESTGELTHTLDAPHIPETKFITLFNKLPTAGDYLEPTLWQLFVKGEVILRPRFKQSLAELRTSRSLSFNLTVVGVTKVYTVPWPHFSSTIYCAEMEGGVLIPVAYAIYRQE